MNNSISNTNFKDAFIINYKNTNNISFKSALKFVTPKQFYHQVERLDKRCCVSSPWTIEQSVVAPSVYTLGIIDCTVCLITDGIKALMVHRCPSWSQNTPFRQFSELFEKIFNIKDSNLQTVVIGAKINSKNPNSEKFFDEFVDCFEKNNIPCSQLKGSNFKNNVLYRSDMDEVLISNDEINEELLKIFTKTPQVIFSKNFEKIKLSDCDEFA